MKREILRKKNQLLSRISQQDYQSLLDYIGEIYLEDYQVKILMARKFSNLFSALLPLVKEEYGGRIQQEYKQKFPTSKEEPRIISNRAMTVVREEIKNKRCKKILLADDIIIHGRTLSSIYNQLVEWFKEAGVYDYTIQIFAYAESIDGLISDKDFLSSRNVKFTCQKDEWRAISNRIVDIFYLLGQPYTSYVPNCRVPFESKLGKVISECLSNKKSEFFVQTSADMSIHGMTAFSYIEKVQYDFILNCSMRLYQYDKLQTYILVPMVMLKPINEDTLSEYFHELSWMLTESGRDIIGRASDSILKYQTVIYLLSALWGWKFSHSYLQFDETVIYYDTEEEKMNFSCNILSYSFVCGETFIDCEEKLRRVGRHYSRNICLNDNDLYEEPGVYELQKVLKKLYEEITENENLKLEDVIRTMMGKFLYENGEMDEKKYMEEKDTIKSSTEQRLMGYPLVKINDLFQDMGDAWIRAILYAIDFGKGSIVPRCFSKKDMNGQVENWFFSVLHAGEQNYKYFANTYFPFLFGLCHLEQMANKKKNFSKLNAWKIKFMEEYQEYWRQNEKFFFLQDMNLLEQMNVTGDFNKVLHTIAWDYFADPDLDYAIKLSKDIMENAEETCQ